MEYQLDPDITSMVLDNGTQDVTWFNISHIVDHNGVLKYGILAILTIFHSSANCESLFCHVTKNKTEFRENLSAKTLVCMLPHKTMLIAAGIPCPKAVISKGVLKKDKSACYNKINS